MFDNIQEHLEGFERLLEILKSDFGNKDHNVITQEEIDDFEKKLQSLKGLPGEDRIKLVQA